MKSAYILASVLAVSAPVWAQSGDFSVAKKSWKDVRLGVNDLDAAIAQKKMADVHATAFNLRDSVRELRGAPLGGPTKTNQLIGLLGQVDALANGLDASGDKNDLRAVVANQRKMHLLLDQISALFPAGTLSKVGAVTVSAPVTDPVCGMTVTPSNAPHLAYQGQTYYFCSQADQNTFKKAPARYAARGEDMAFGKPKTYSFTLTTSGKVAAGRTSTLNFAVREKGQSGLVKKYQLVHEKLIHLIVVSDDLSYFSHEHPNLGKDSVFHLQTRFPSGGKYLLFGDFTPADGLNQIQRAVVDVSGAKAAPAPLVADKNLSRTVDGLTVSLQISTPLQTGKPSLLTYTLRENGALLTDMQPYLGAMGHLMAINRNGIAAVHTHTVSPGGAVTESMATAKGPRFTYVLTPKAAGLTKIWAQFQRDGRVLTVPFTVNVAS